MWGNGGSFIENKNSTLAASGSWRPQEEPPAPTSCFLSFSEGINLMVSHRHFHASGISPICWVGPQVLSGSLRFYWPHTDLVLGTTVKNKTKHCIARPHLGGKQHDADLMYTTGLGMSYS